MAKLQAFDTDQFAEKISALSIYDSNLLTMLYQNPVNKQKINRGAALLVRNYFDLYLDSRARQNPSAYHHVYEFEKTGNPTARLFKAVVTNAPDGSAFINYSFNQAKDPNPEGYPFPNKADVMERGETIIVTPKRGRYLRYRLEDGQFVTSEKSVIRNPGGDQVRGSFESTFRSFMTSQSSIILQKFRFFEKIELSILNKRRLSIPRINSGMTADAANRAKIDAMSIADGVISTYA